MPDVFISYKKEDLDRVAPIAKGLAEAGYEVWWDHRIPPGRSYRDVIGAALEAAKCVIVVWSSQSVAGQWVLDEADTGKKRNVLLPILIDPVDIPYGFRQIEAANLIGWTGDRSHSEWGSVIEAVAHFVGRPAGGPAKPFVTPSAPKAPPVAPQPPAFEPVSPPPKKSGPAPALFAVIAALAIGAAGFGAWQAGLFGGGSSPEAIDAATTEEPAAEEAAAVVPKVLSIKGNENSTIRRISDSAYVWFAEDGCPVARLDITQEIGGQTFVTDPTNKQSAIFNAETKTVEAIKEDGTTEVVNESFEFEIGAFDAPAAQPANAATMIWFEGGGGLALMNGVWIESAGPENTCKGHQWNPVDASDDVLVLEQASRGAKARVTFSKNQVELWFPDWNEWRVHWKIRAADAVTLP